MKNILFLVHRVPHPPNRGDRIRSYNLLRHLSERANVHLACLADEPITDRSVAALEELCAAVAVVPIGRSRWLHAVLSIAAGRTATVGLFHSSYLRQVVRTWASHTQFDSVVAFCSSMVPYLNVPELQGVRTLVDLVDVDSQKWFDYARTANGLRRFAFRLEGRRLRDLETELASRVDAVTLVSDAEASLLHEFASSDRVHGIANGVDLEYFRPDTARSATDAAEPEFVFVGALDYRANVEGLCWFCKNIWPKVRQRLPGVRLALVGRRPASKVRGLASQPGVVLIGEVPDVRPHVAAAELVVAPLQIARGIQNKVLEGLAMGKAVVATPQALEGLDINPNVDVACPNTPQEWVARLVELHRSPSERMRLGNAGRNFVEQNHSWSSSFSPFDQLLQLHDTGVSHSA